MMLNWNKNDTKYILKKVIILLLGMILLFGYSKRAHAMELGKPTMSQAYILDTPGDYNNGVWLVNNNINNLVFISRDGEHEERFWQIFNYNNNQRLHYLIARYNFPQTINDNAIIKFRFAYQTTLVSDSMSTLVSRIFIQYQDDPAQTDCGVTQIGYDTSIGAVNYEVKCVTSGYTPEFIAVTFKPIANDYIDNKYYISENIEYRLPVDNQELYDVMDEIANGQQYLYDLWDNAGVDSSLIYSESFFTNFDFGNDIGLETIVRLPLAMVQRLQNECQPINLPLPFVGGNVTLPCMSTIYEEHFGGIIGFVELVVNGFLAYRLLLKCFELIHESKDPAIDKVEVIKL